MAIIGIAALGMFYELIRFIKYSVIKGYKTRKQEENEPVLKNDNEKWISFICYQDITDIYLDCRMNDRTVLKLKAFIVKFEGIS